MAASPTTTSTLPCWSRIRACAVSPCARPSPPRRLRPPSCARSTSIPTRWMRSVASTRLRFPASNLPLQPRFARLPPCACFLAFAFACPHRSPSDQVAEQALGAGGDLVDGAGEGCFVGLRGLVDAADLAHELQRRVAYLLRRRRRLEIVQDPNIATHDPIIAGPTFDRRRDHGAEAERGGIRTCQGADQTGPGGPRLEG